MKKFLVAIFVFAALFIFKSVSAELVSAAGATITGSFSNAAGSISVNVTYTIKRVSGGVPGITICSGTATAVGVRGTLPINCVDFSDWGSYILSSWSNSCGDSGSSTITGSGGNYTFDAIDVHCKQPNSSITVYQTNCSNSDGQIRWRVTPGAAGANIAYFKIYKSLGGNPDSDTSPLQLSYTYGETDYIFSNGLQGLANGTWFLRVKAFTNAPDNNSVNADGQFTCPGSFAPPSNLTTNINCVNPSPLSYRVDFSWNAASPGSYTYEVQTTTSVSGPWPGTTFTPSPNTNTYYSVGSGFSAGTQYWWRVKATQSDTGTINYSNGASFTTPSSCPAQVPAASLNITFCERGGFNALPNDVTFHWIRATPTASIQAEKLEYSTNSNFPPDSSTISTAVPGGYYDPNPDINFTAGTRYYWRINTQMNNIWYPSATKMFEAIYQCDYDYSGSFNITLYGYSYCEGSVVRDFLYWQGGRYTYTVHYYFWYEPWQQYVQAAPYETSQAYTLNSQGAPPPRYYKVSWVNGGSVVYSNQLTMSTPSCSPSPGAPSNLQAVVTPPSTVVGCKNNLPSIDLQFQDNSSSETSYEINVSKEPFTGDATTNPSNMWGVKSLPPNTTTFTWSAASPLDWADANPQDPTTTNNLIPLEETTYYWRVKTMSNGSQSNYMYPDGTVNSTQYPAGLPFRIPICKQGYDLKVSYVPGSVRKFATQEYTNIFAVGDEVNADFEIVNLKGSQPYSNATNLYFYYKPATMPNCTATAASGIPVDGATPTPNSQFYPVGAIPVGGSVQITARFNVGSIVGTFLGNSYVIPDCVLGSGLSEYDWESNNTNTSGGARLVYSVGASKFFQTTGGDLGAKGTISAGADGSCAPSPGPYYQSDYGITGGSIGTYIKGKSNGTGANFTANVVSGGVDSYTVVSRGGGYLGSSVSVVVEGGGGSGATATANMIGNLVWSVSKVNAGSGYTSTPTVKFCPSGPAFKNASYNRPLVPAGGVYNYFASRFRAKASTGTNLCTFSTGTYNNGYYYCTGNAKVTGGNTVTITGNPVIFVDGDLVVDANVAASGASNSVVFIVKGNITTNTYSGWPDAPVVINNLDGVYIARKGFADNGGDLGQIPFVTGGVSNALTVNGSVYVDVEEGSKVNLSRYFNSPNTNFVVPSDIFKFDPKYIVILNTLLAASPVGWKEVAP